MAIRKNGQFLYSLLSIGIIMICFYIIIATWLTINVDIQYGQGAYLVSYLEHKLNVGELFYTSALHREFNEVNYICSDIDSASNYKLITELCLNEFIEKFQSAGMSIRDRNNMFFHIYFKNDEIIADSVTPLSYHFRFNVRNWVGHDVHPLTLKKFYDYDFRLSEKGSVYVERHISYSHRHPDVRLITLYEQKDIIEEYLLGSVILSLLDNSRLEGESILAYVSRNKDFIEARFDEMFGLYDNDLIKEDLFVNPARNSLYIRIQRKSDGDTFLLPLVLDADTVDLVYALY